ncbi:MAG: cytochrome c oxidase subunit 2A [Gemmatimonadota bacterium]
MNDERSEFDDLADVSGHPKGTLAIVGVYGALFVVGWLVLYFFVFLPRGTLTP